MAQSNAAGDNTDRAARSLCEHLCALRRRNLLSTTSAVKPPSTSIRDEITTIDAELTEPAELLEVFVLRVQRFLR